MTNLIDHNGPKIVGDLGQSPETLLAKTHEKNGELWGKETSTSNPFIIHWGQIRNEQHANMILNLNLRVPNWGGVTVMQRTMHGDCFDKRIPKFWPKKIQKLVKKLVRSSLNFSLDAKFLWPPPPKWNHPKTNLGGPSKNPKWTPPQPSKICFLEFLLTDWHSNHHHFSVCQKQKTSFGGLCPTSPFLSSIYGGICTWSEFGLKIWGH